MKIPGKEVEIPFMICALPRTGSNLLTGMLDSHPQVKIYNELFHFRSRYVKFLARDLGFDVSAEPGFVSWWRRWQLYGGSSPRNYSELNWIRTQKPGAFVRRILFHPRIMSFHHAVGCKVQPWQLLSNYSSHQRNCLRRNLEKQKNFRIIFLERSNALEQFVSGRAANQCAKWRVLNPNDVPGLEKRKVEVDACEFLKFVENNKKKMTKIHALFGNIPSFHTTYEKLSGDQTAVMAEIQRFLQVEVLPLVPADVKINKESLAYRISNFDSLRRQLAGTEEERFLTGGRSQ